jgi:nicotinate-nucleotide adenylyltransferase
LIIAEQVREEFKLDRILFIPSGQPPHKDNTKVTGAEHRYSMLERAVSANPNFDVSPIEIEREGFTYTVDTLVQLRGLFSCRINIYFII